MSVITTVPCDATEDIFTRIQGMKVRIRRRIDAGPPLLLINGLGACLEAWDPLTRRLPGRDVLGFSFGGTVAQQIARDFPERVNSLVLCATAPGLGGVPADPVTLMVAANPWRYVVPTIRELAAPIIYRGRCGRDPGLFETELVGWDAHRTTLLGVGAQIAAFVGWSSVSWLPTLAKPTLVLGGAEDPMAPAENSRLIAQMIPGAELHVIEQGGHLFPFDLPDEAAPLIRAFLTRVHGPSQPVHP
jgi:pimeloyl-ACP methyl ester carboxylesterase